MATVPRTPSLSVAPSAAPNVQLQNANTAELTTIGDRQAQQFGQALGGAGTELTRIDAVQQRLADEAGKRADLLRIDDAVNQGQEAAIRLRADPKDGYLTKTGAAALPQDGVALTDRFATKLDVEFDRIEGTLSNDRQRELWRTKKQTLRNQFLDNALSHEGQQIKTYEASVNEATGSQASEMISQLPQNPASVRLHTYRLQASIMGGVDPDTGAFVPGLAQRSGKSAAWAQEEAGKAVSGAYVNAINGLIDRGDLTGAENFRKTYAGSIRASDLLRINNTLQTQVDQRTAQAFAGQIWSRAQPAIQPNDVDRAFNLVINTESGGRQLDDKGAPLTSPKGAIGIAQVMSDTAKAAAKRMGVEWDENRYRTDAAYNKALGRNEFEYQLKSFDGDVAKSLAAYNAGPRWVKEAEQRAAKAPEGSEQANWLWQLNNDGRDPKNRLETQNYVAKNMAVYASGGGAPAKPTLADVHAEADRALGPNASPLVRKTVMDQLTGKFHEQEAAFKQRGDEAVAQGYRELDANGGNVATMSPKTRAAITQYAPGKLDELMAFAGKVATGTPIATDWNAYADLRAMASTNPQQFAKVNLQAHFTKLAPAQREQLIDLQTKASDPKSVPDIASLDAQLGNAHDLLKLGTSDQEKKGKFDSAVTTQLAAAQAEKGSKLTYDERQKVIDRMMVPGDVPGAWFGTTTKKLYEVTGTEAASKFSPTPPPAEKEKIEAAFKRAGRAYTDADVTRLYRQKVGL